MRCRHFVLCDRVERDPKTGDVAGAVTVLDELRTNSGHGTLKPAHIWARLHGDSHKVTKLSVSLSEPAIGDTPTHDGWVRVRSLPLMEHRTVQEEPGKGLEFVVDVAPIRFPSWGRYVVLLWADGKVIAEREVSVVPRPVGSA